MSKSTSLAPTELFCSGKKTLERNTVRIEIGMHRSTIHIVSRGMIPRYGRYVYMGICLPICLFHIEWLLTLSNDVSGKIWYWLIDKNLAQKIKNRIKQSFINSRPWYRVSSFVNIFFIDSGPGLNGPNWEYQWTSDRQGFYSHEKTSYRLFDTGLLVRLGVVKRLLNWCIQNSGYITVSLVSVTVLKYL